MTERPPWEDDPFLANDPAARERAERWAEREARRKERVARSQDKAAQEELRAAEARRRDAERQAEQERRDADRRARRDAELQQREATRRQQATARQTTPAEPQPAPPPALLDEPAPAFDPWVTELDEQAAAAARGGGRTRLLSRPRLPMLVAGGVVVGLIAWFLVALFQPFAGDGEGSGEVQVNIQRNTPFGEIADLLDEEGVISSATLFEIRATLAGRRSDLLAGRYTLAEGMSYSRVLDVLTTPAPQRTNTVTIPEGLTREQIADVVADSGVEGSYARASEGSDALDPADYGAKGAENLEGFLFPDTYDLKPHATADDLVTAQLESFKRNFGEVDMSYAESKNLTQYDVLIIASMIEEEAAVADDRPLVARVIYNRLADGGPLGIDATIRYAQANYNEPLLESDLAIDSPYNTYENAGLPPTPIANPGLASIEAAANPAEGDWYYFVVKPGTCGELEFSETAAEHDAAVERYHTARDEAGGRSPVDC